MQASRTSNRHQIAVDSIGSCDLYHFVVRGVSSCSFGCGPQRSFRALCFFIFCEHVIYLGTSCGDTQIINYKLLPLLHSHPTYRDSHPTRWKQRSVFLDCGPQGSHFDNRTLTIVLRAHTRTHRTAVVSRNTRPPLVPRKRTPRVPWTYHQLNILSLPRSLRTIPSIRRLIDPSPDRRFVPPRQLRPGRRRSGNERCLHALVTGSPCVRPCLFFALRVAEGFTPLPSRVYPDRDLKTAVMRGRPKMPRRSAHVSQCRHAHVPHTSPFPPPAPVICCVVD